MKRTRVAAAAWLIVAGPAWAGAATDGSAGAVRQLSGAMQIPQSLGTVRGTNLFHSFAQFSIASGESALFTTSDASLRHVIARVTGGQASSFEGPLALLAAAGSRPDFWFVNPRGIVVGAGASFDVPAGLHLGSAPQLRFADGSALDAGSATGSSFSVEAPERFGFLSGAQAGALVLQGTGFRLAPGADLTLAGGEVTLAGAAVQAPDGHVWVQSSGHVSFSNGTRVLAGSGDAISKSSIEIDARSMSLIGVTDAPTLVFSNAVAPTVSGGVTIRLADALTVGPYSSVEARGASLAGGIDIAADRVQLHGLGASLATSSRLSTGGPALRVAVQGALELSGGAAISSFAEAEGVGGPISIAARSVQMHGGVADATTRIEAWGNVNGPGPVNIEAAESVELRDHARVVSLNPSTGDAGLLSIHAHNVSLEGSSIGALAIGAGVPAALQIEAVDTVRLGTNSLIASGSSGTRDAGQIRLIGSRVDLDGSLGPASIRSTSLGTGRGGSVQIESGELAITGNARVSTSTSELAGAAGNIAVSADRILLDGRGQIAAIDSVGFGPGGSAGTIRVRAHEWLHVVDGGAIVAAAVGGSPGSIDIQADQVVMSGRGTAVTRTGIVGIASSSIGTGSGVGASVTIEARRIEVLAGAEISTETQTASSGRPIQISSDFLLVDGAGTNADSITRISATSFAGGDAGNVTIGAREVNLANQGFISTVSMAEGRGGALRIEASTVRASESSGLSSGTAGSGDAGGVSVVAHESIELLNGGFVSAHTTAAGAAGQIDIQAGRLSMRGFAALNGNASGISGRAAEGSSGRTASLSLSVSGLAEMADGAQITIANGARVADPGSIAPSRISLDVGSLTMNGSAITASSFANVTAGSISVRARDGASLVGSGIGTTANEGDGGSIALSTAGLLQMRDSSITTSVAGTRSGNGGDISVGAYAMLMRSAFVQANTAAPSARGGRVAIDTRLLVPDAGALRLGGTRIEQPRAGVAGFNVIQAAAPDGVSGTLDVTSPELNLSGTLARIFSQRIEFGDLGRDLCELDAASSFALGGRGALPTRASDVLRFGPRLAP